MLHEREYGLKTISAGAYENLKNWVFRKATQTPNSSMDKRHSHYVDRK